MIQLSKIYASTTKNELKKTGDDFLGLCPFHDDTTPSFCISDKKNLFVCYACGEAGDEVSFYSKVRNVSRFEAVRALSINYGGDYSNDVRFLIGSLPQTAGKKYPEQMEWLASRADGTSVRFASKRMLKNFVANSYGKMLSNVANNFGDMMEGVFALHFGITGGVLNVVYARLFNKKAKYLQLFSNGKPYGKSGEVCYIVEGFSDCDAILATGRNCISMNGLHVGNINFTSFKRVIFWVDGDEAGKKFLVKLNKQEINCAVDVVYSDGYDPNSYLLNKDMPVPVSYMEWRLKYTELNSYELTELILKRPNFCNLSILTEEYCQAHGINKNVVDISIDTVQLRNRSLALDFVNSGKTGILPTDFFGYKDIDDFYRMALDNRPLALSKYPYLLGASTMHTDEVYTALNNLYIARSVKKNLHKVAYGEVALATLIPKENQHKKQTLLTAYENNKHGGDIMVPFPFKQLAELYGGLYRGKLMMVGGVTGSNKTTMCINLMHEAMIKGLRVLYFNGEMLEIELINRLLAVKCDVPINDVSSELIEKNRDYLNSLDVDNNLNYDNVTNIGGYDLVVVDYVQRVQGGASMAKYELYSMVTSELKRLAMVHDVAVVVAAQYNSSKMASENKYDMLAGAKAMMNDVDLSIYIEKKDNSLLRTLQINKCRYAPDGGFIEMILDNLYLKFKDKSDDKEINKMDTPQNIYGQNDDDNPWGET